MNSSDNLAALIYLKNKLHKWKNVAIILIVISTFLFLRLVATGGLSDGVAQGGGDYIAEVKIQGVIVEDEFRTEVLKEIFEEDSIKAVVININSPGGGIVASEVLFEELRKLSVKKPIVAIMSSVAASGGYMAAIASDHIIARNGTLTGSIGVLMQTTEFTDLAKKVGVKFNNYKSSPLKGAPSPYEKSTPMVDYVVNKSIKDSYEFFADLVKERRKGKLAKNTNSILDGRVFNGRQALAAGLIDEIGGKDQALAYLKKAHNIDVKKLPLRRVVVKRQEKKIYNKFLGMIPFFNKAKSLEENQGIMAIMSM